MLRRTDFDNVPVKPQRVFQEMNAVFDDNTRFITAIGLGQIASGQFQRVNKPRNYIICGQAGPLGWDVPAAIGAKLADPDAEVVAVCGDYSFQFLIEELAVGAQYNVPFVVVLLNNSYLGLIRQAERAYDMDFEVQLSFENVNCPEIGEYGVDHVRAAEAFGCIGARVFKPEDLAPTLQWARKESVERRLPVVVEVILERVTNIAMGPEIDKITEFEEIVDLPAEMSLEPEEVLADEE
jgi:tartronate-semialdehyde synthase